MLPTPEERRDYIVGTIQNRIPEIKIRTELHDFQRELRVLFSTGDFRKRSYHYIFHDFERRTNGMLISELTRYIETAYPKLAEVE